MAPKAVQRRGPPVESYAIWGCLGALFAAMLIAFLTHRHAAVTLASQTIASKIHRSLGGALGHLGRVLMLARRDGLLQTIHRTVLAETPADCQSAEAGSHSEELHHDQIVSTSPTSHEPTADQFHDVCLEIQTAWASDEDQRRRPEGFKRAEFGSGIASTIRNKQPTEFVRHRSPNEQVALWQFGVLLAIAGPLVYFALSLIWPLGSLDTNEMRGAAFGRGLATIASVVVGLALIAKHVVRRR